MEPPFIKTHDTKEVPRQTKGEKSEREAKGKELHGKRASMREGVGALRLVGRRARFYMLHAGRLSSPPSLTAVHPEDTYPPNTLELPFRASFVRAEADYPDYPASYRSRCLKATTPIAVTTIHPLLTHRPLPPPDFSTFHDAAVAATASSVSRRRYYPPDRLCLPRCSTRDEGLPYLR